jgi:hypothetical protein
MTIRISARLTLLSIVLVTVLVAALGAAACRSAQIDATVVPSVDSTATASSSPASAATTPISSVPRIGTPVPSTAAPTNATTQPPPGATDAPATSTPVPTTSTPQPSPTLDATTPTAVAQPSSSPAAPPNAANEDGVDAAVQRLADYFYVLNDRQFTNAYAYWDRGGAASGQTAAEFASGFADTVQIDMQFGSDVHYEATDERGSSATSDSVTLPVTLLSAINDPASQPLGQRVQTFRGTYVMKRVAEPVSDPRSWRIASARIAEDANVTLPLAEASDLTSLLRSYVDAINRREYARAYTCWAHVGRSSHQTFHEFRQGFAKTDRVKLAMGATQSEGAAGSIYATVPVVLVATDRDGSTHSFCGTYTVRRLNVPPFEKLGWHIEGADVKTTANVEPGSAKEQQLLSGACPQ